MNRTVLLIDDEPAVLESVGRYLERAGFEVLRETTGRAGITRYQQLAPDIVVLDLGLPDGSGLGYLERLRQLNAAVIVLTGHGDVDTAVRAMQLGAKNFLAKPVDLAHLAAALARAYDKIHLKREVNRLRSRALPPVDAAALGVSPQMEELGRQVQMLAHSDRTSVLLTGECGTGKGFVARMIHEMSPRAAAPFIDVNCGGLSATFMDRELFGHDTAISPAGTERTQGLFELADGGTIFLNEISELAPELQPKLLKVLESKKFRRVGGTREISIDVRIIAATNKDLAAEVAGGSFREDLYYRLSVLPLHVVPLRDRARDDRLCILHRLLADLCSSIPDAEPEIQAPALQRLLGYSWPGNVREMRNVLERALILARGRPIGPEHLPAEFPSGLRTVEGGAGSMTLKEVERQHIERALRSNKGNRTHSARELGISRATLIKKIKMYQLDC